MPLELGPRGSLTPKKHIISDLSEKENIMAVQQNKKSRSRKGMRRSHDRVATPTVIYCSCGEPTVPHSVCPNCGAYKGRQVIAKTEAE